MANTFGYCRVSTASQNVERQVRNIFAAEPSAIIYKESFTGTTMSRPEWKKLMKRVRAGDRIIFDSVSRMSRDEDEGVQAYFELDARGICLVFLNEPMINTETYHTAVAASIPMTGTAVDPILEGVNTFLRNLAEQQIRIGFQQAAKERNDLAERTRGGIETARRNGKQIGQVAGAKLHVKKAETAKAIIVKNNRDFGGALNDTDTMKLCGVSRNSYYKYKAELKADPTLGDDEV